MAGTIIFQVVCGFLISLAGIFIFPALGWGEFPLIPFFGGFFGWIVISLLVQIAKQGEKKDKKEDEDK